MTVMKLFRAKSFRKDYQKLKISDKQYEKYIKYLSLLLGEQSLPAEALDHNLIGNYLGFREFHIGGDVLVIYCIEDEILSCTNNQ